MCEFCTVMGGSPGVTSCQYLARIEERVHSATVKRPHQTTGKNRCAQIWRSALGVLSRVNHRGVKYGIQKITPPILALDDP